MHGTKSLKSDHFYLVPRLMSGALHSLPLYAIITWTGITFEVVPFVCLNLLGRSLQCLCA